LGGLHFVGSLLGVDSGPKQPVNGASAWIAVILLWMATLGFDGIIWRLTRRGFPEDLDVRFPRGHPIATVFEFALAETSAIIFGITYRFSAQQSVSLPLATALITGTVIPWGSAVILAFVAWRVARS
jgi:hypothetical protein